MTSPHHPFLVFKVFFFHSKSPVSKFENASNNTIFYKDITKTLSNCLHKVQNITVHYG